MILEQINQSLASIAASLEKLATKMGSVASDNSEELPVGRVIGQTSLPSAAVASDAKRGAPTPAASPDFSIGAAQLGGTFTNGDYANLTREKLLELCQERGITVADRTRTATLVKMLEEATGAGTVKETPADPTPEPDPLDEPTLEPDPLDDPAPEPDPLDDPAPEPDPLADTPAEKPVTKEEVIAVMQRLQKAKGNDAVRNVLLIAGGGAALLRDVREADYGKVKAAAEKAMG